MKDEKENKDTYLVKVFNFQRKMQYKLISLVSNKTFLSIIILISVVGSYYMYSNSVKIMNSIEIDKVIYMEKDNNSYIKVLKRLI